MIKKKSCLHYQKPSQYLLELSITRAHKRHGVASVVVRRHRGHAILLVYVERNALNGAGPPQRLVEVLTAEVVVDLQRLEGGGEQKKNFNGALKLVATR